MANDKGGTPAQAEAEKAGLDALRALMFSVETNRFHQQVNYLRAVADRPDLKNDSIARMVEQLNEQVKEAKDAEREIPALVAMVRDARKAAEDALRYVEDKWAPINKEAGKAAGDPPNGDRVPKYGGYSEMRPSDAFEPPAKWDEKYRRALNSLRESGKINMFGASPVLQQMFPNLSASEARSIVVYWMKTFKEADEKAAGPAPAPALLASLFSAAVNGGKAEKQAPAAVKSDDWLDNHKPDPAETKEALESLVRMSQALGSLDGTVAGFKSFIKGNVANTADYVANGYRQWGRVGLTPTASLAAGNLTGPANDMGNVVYALMEHARAMRSASDAFAGEVGKYEALSDKLSSAAREGMFKLSRFKEGPAPAEAGEKGLPLHPQYIEGYYKAGKAILLRAANAANSAWNGATEIDTEIFANTTTDYTGVRRLINDGIDGLWRASKNLTEAARATMKATKEAPAPEPAKGEKAIPQKADFQAANTAARAIIAAIDSVMGQGRALVELTRNYNMRVQGNSQNGLDSLVEARTNFLDVQLETAAAVRDFGSENPIPGFVNRQRKEAPPAPAAENAHPTSVQIGFDPLKGLTK